MAGDFNRDPLAYFLSRYLLSIILRRKHVVTVDFRSPPLLWTLFNSLFKRRDTIYRSGGPLFAPADAAVSQRETTGSGSVDTIRWTG